MCVAALDSVLKKAEELENSLKLWRERLGFVSTPVEADTSRSWPLSCNQLEFCDLQQQRMAPPSVEW